MIHSMYKSYLVHSCSHVFMHSCSHAPELLFYLIYHNRNIYNQLSHLFDVLIFIFAEYILLLEERSYNIQKRKP